MSAASDSDDVSDIFWPGYVDAISNLAINLLFVIAIMAIVVISATLQLQELMKRKDKDPAQISATTTSAAPTPEALQDIVAKQQKTIAQQAAQIRKLQEDARQAERRASASSAPSRPDSQEPPAPAERAGPLGLAVLGLPERRAAAGSRHGRGPASWRREANKILPGAAEDVSCRGLLPRARGFRVRAG